MPKGGRPPLRVVLGVTGSIAAYKACELVRRARELPAEIRCVLTRSAREFVSPLTLGVLSGSPALTDLYDPKLWEMAHLGLARWADVVLVAPATADFMARLWSGRAEELLDSLILAAPKKIVLCPAMDSEMWEHPATRRNAKELKSWGCEFWGPAEGKLASGRVGPGRLMEVTEIVERLGRLAIAR